MNDCSLIRNQFSEYLDGAISGAEMQAIARHLERCADCAAEFAGWRNMQTLVSSVGPARAPEDLGLRLRVALSQQAAHSAGDSIDRWKIRWQNSVRPFVLQASAGLACTLLLLGMVSLLASPEPLLARDEPVGTATSPQFLYSSLEPAGAIGDRDNPVIVEAFINGKGRVYDYQIVSGMADSKTRCELENTLLFSVFAPARVFGQPVRGMVLLSYSDVSVRG